MFNTNESNFLQFNTWYANQGKKFQNIGSQIKANDEYSFENCSSNLLPTGLYQVNCFSTRHIISEKLKLHFRAKPTSIFLNIKINVDSQIRFQNHSVVSTSQLLDDPIFFMV